MAGEAPIGPLFVALGMLAMLGWLVVATERRRWGDILAVYGLVGAAAVGTSLVVGRGLSGAWNLSSLGAMAGGVLGLVCAVVLTRSEGMADLADRFVPAGLVGLAVARLGCLWAGCDFGRRHAEGIWTVDYGRHSRAWAVHMLEYDLAPTSTTSYSVYPFAAYLAIWGLVAAIVGEGLRRRQARAGRPALAAALVFLIGGGIIEWWREPATVPTIGDNWSVYPLIYWAGAVAAVSIFGLWSRYSRNQEII